MRFFSYILMAFLLRARSLSVLQKTCLTQYSIFMSFSLVLAIIWIIMNLRIWGSRKQL